MTTIMTDGHFLIADHRTSGSLRVRKTTGLVYRDNFNDETNKIVKCSIAFERRKEQEEIVALACSGNAEEIDLFHKAVSDGLITTTDQLRLFLELQWADCDFVHKHPFSVVFVSNKNKVYTARLNYKKGMRRAAVEIWTNVLKEGQVHAIGSGRKYLEVFSSLGIGNIPLIHRFLVATYFDKGSSTSYDVYSVAEEKLVLDCRPSTEDVKEIIVNNCNFVACYRGRKNSLHTGIYAVNHIS